MAHFPNIPCAWCERGWQMLRIFVAPDSTGCAPPDYRFYAFDQDRYDGAPDAGERSRCLGHGPTPEYAVADLLRQIEECAP